MKAGKWFAALLSESETVEKRKVREVYQHACCSTKIEPGSPFIVYGGGGLRAHDRRGVELGRGTTPAKAWGAALKAIEETGK